MHQSGSFLAAAISFEVLWADYLRALCDTERARWGGKESRP
jgi:hypothetical protein